LAKLQDTASAALSNSNVSCGLEDCGINSNVDKRACSVSACNEVCAALEIASDVGDDAMQAANKLITELGKNFASQLQDVEARFQAQTERQMTLLENSLESMKRLKNQMQELTPATMPANSKETVAPMMAKAAKQSPALPSHGPVLNHGQSAINPKKHELSTGPEVAKVSKSLELQTSVMQSQNMTKDSVYTPRPVAYCASAQVAAWKATQHSSTLAAICSPLMQSRHMQRSVTSSSCKINQTPAVNAPVVRRPSIPTSPGLTNRCAGVSSALTASADPVGLAGQCPRLSRR